MSYLQQLHIIKHSPAPLTVELEVYGHGTTLLESVEFMDGAIATTPVDHARLVAARYDDPNWERHKSWDEIEKTAQAIHAQLAGRASEMLATA